MDKEKPFADRQREHAQPISSPEQTRDFEQKELSPTEQGVNEAQRFFEDMGLPVDGEGFINVDEVTDEQLSALSTWRNDTMTGPGIEMNTPEDFYRKVLLAVSLSRQKSPDGKIAYLMGKGTGVEIALLGNAVGRAKRDIDFSYRSHSDFEIYGVPCSYDDHGHYESDEPYSVPFQQVFGNQEYFPQESTKGLVNLPSDLLHRTAQVVDFGGVPILVPELELLFLDKFNSREGTPRDEGYDHELLAKQYPLDRDKLHYYLDEYVIEPAKASIEKHAEQKLPSHIESIGKHYLWAFQDLERSGMEDITADAVADKLNENIAQMQEITQGQATDYSGIHFDLWIPVEGSYFDQAGTVVDADYLQALETRTKYVVKKRTETLVAKHTQLDELFDGLD